MKLAFYARLSAVVSLLALSALPAAAQQVLWKDNPISGKVVGLTYGTSSWPQGEAQAVAYGGHLVTVRSQAENSWLANEFIQPFGEAFIGFTDSAPYSVEGQWKWASAEATSFLGWAAAEPNNGQGYAEQDYAIMWHNPVGTWDDTFNSQNWRSLIEVQQRPARSWSWPTIYSTGAQALYSTVVDIDGDKDKDLIVPTQGSLSIFRNNGVGGLQISQSIGGCGNATSTAVGDVDKDNDFDLLLTDFSSGKRVLFLEQLANGFFAAPQVIWQTAEVPHFVCLQDLDHDGLGDAIVTYDGSSPSQAQMRIYWGIPTGGFDPNASVFSSLVDSGAASVDVGDINADGLLDIVVGGGWNGTVGVRVLRGAANRDFIPETNGISTTFCLKPRLQDWDGDGDLDLVAPEGQGTTVRTYSNNGGFSFAQQASLNVGGRCYWTEFEDVDGDGDADLVTVLPDLARASVWLRASPSGYVFDHELATGSYPVWVGVVDLSGDGKADVITSNRDGGSISVAANQSKFDCNGNGIDDPIDIANGSAADCNRNGRPDSCDFAFGLDTDGDGILDGCEPTLVSLSPAVRAAFSAGSVSVATTNVPNGVATLTLSSPSFAQPIVRTFAIANNAGSVSLPALSAPSASDVVASGTISFTDALGNTVVTDATADVFTWDVPRIVAASPSNAPYDQTTGVTFFLADHIGTGGFGTAKFGSGAPQPAYLFAANGQTFATTIAPAQPAPGPVDVLLQFGSEYTLAQRGFVFLGPGVTNLSVTSGWQAGGEALDVELYGFAPNVPVDVIFGSGASAVSVAALPSGVAAQSFLSLTTPYLPAAGALDFTVVQNAGLPSEKRVVSPGAWLAEAPRIAGVSPSSGFQGGGDLVTLSLEGFPAGVATRIELGSQVYNATNSGTLDLSTASLTTTLAPLAGPVDVNVRQGLGGPTPLNATLAAGFTLDGPSLLGVQPTSGPLEGGTQVIAKTAGFDPSQPAQVQIGGTTLVGTVTGVGTAQTVSFRTTLATASGASDVTLSQGVLVATLPAAFTFDAARVTPYCQAKLTSAGLLPVIGFTGSPSASTGDFAITLSNALPNKVGLYFHGAVATAPFQSFYGGKLCVQPPTQRGPTIQTDANGFASSPFTVTPAMVGTDRAIQWWFRDPADANTVGLSRGLKVLGFYP